MQDRELVEKAIAEDLLAPALSGGEARVLPPEGYELVECLGSGGAGTVYLAWERNLRRKVALKFLTNARPADVERFRREARFAARLDHTAIVQIYELGESFDQPYIAMQYVDGGYLGQADLDERTLIQVMRTVAEALHRAHGQGIIHRDIKPQNILLDRQRQPYVTDFGVARDLRGEFGATLSSEGIILGTPELMPPEQARGDQRAIDARSDIYALGATLYVMLTGHMPFERENLVEVLHAVLHDEPPFPRSFSPDIPRKLEAIALRCLRKNKRDRYQNMEEVITDFDDYLEGGVVKAESSAWFRKLVGARPAPRPTPPPDSEIPFWSQAIEVAREISGWDANLYRVTSNLPRTFATLDSIVGRLDGLLAEHPDVGWARFYRGVARFRLGCLSEALDDMERSIDRVGDLASAYFELGRLYLALHLDANLDAHKHITRMGTEHQIDSARPRLDQAVFMFEEAKRLQGTLPAWQLEFAQAVAHLAEQDYPACVEACDRILEQDPDLEEVWKLRGDALRFAREDPIPSYDRAAEIRRSYYPALMAKAEVLCRAGRHQEARSTLRRVLEILPDLPDALAQCARTYLAEGREGGDPAAFSRARELASRALELNPRHYEATVTRAEVGFEQLKAGPAKASEDAVFQDLERARTLPGCGNRVELLRARTLLLKAERSPDAEVARVALDRVLGMSDGEFAALPDATGWREVRARAQELGARLPRT